MTTKTISKFTIALLMLIVSNTITYSQDNMVFMGRNTPQKFLINPALVPDNARFFISMPIIGGLNANFTGNVSYSDIFNINTSNKTVINSENLIKNLNDNNNFRNILNLDIINLGFRVSKNGFMGISLRGMTSSDISFSKDLVSFIMDNPIERVGMFNIALTPDVLSWGELGISYSHKIKNFTIGARVKGIVGGASIQTRNAVISADKKLESYTLQGDIDIMAGNLNLSKDDENAYSLKNISPGFGVDLGVSYLSNNKKLNAYASISDFGRIFWNEKSSTRIVSKNPNAKYKWTGVTDLDNLINQTKKFNDVLEDALNEMTSTMEIDTVKTSYTSNLPFAIQAGARYAFDNELKHNISLNALCKVPQFSKTYYEISTGYTYSSKNKRWDLMASYTYKSIAPFNIGIGGLYRGRGFEIFLMTDSINSYFNYRTAKSANFRLGLNFYCPLKTQKYKQKHRNRGSMIW